MERPHRIIAVTPEGQEPQVLPHHDPLLLVEKTEAFQVADPVDSGEFQVTERVRAMLSQANRFQPWGGQTTSLTVAAPSSVSPSRTFSTTCAAQGSSRGAKKRQLKTERERAQAAAAGRLRSSYNYEVSVGGAGSIGDEPAVSHKEDETMPGAAPLALPLDEFGAIADPADFRDVSLRVLVNPFVDLPQPGRAMPSLTPPGRDLKGKDYASEHLTDVSGGQALKHVGTAQDVLMHPERFNLSEGGRGQQSQEIRALEHDRGERAAHADATSDDGSPVSPSIREALERQGVLPEGMPQEGTGFTG